MSAAPQVALPRWIDIGLLPIINLIQALIVAGLVVLVIGVNPFDAMRIMAWGAVYDSVAISYTLYYATDFVFTGLAVAVAFHAGLFNIGGEGQAYIAGLGCTLVILLLDAYLPGILLIPLALIGGDGVRRRLGADPGLSAGLSRQPHRDHHHHVQLHRRVADGLYRLGHPAAAGRHAAEQPGVPACRLSAARA